MRQLALHASALNDSEYHFYTSSLADIADDSDPDGVHNDAYYERITVGVREARAWLRGRYAHIPASTIDAILKFFAPSDTLSGGQFFAALRLVVHVDNGKQIERSFAFVQAYPISSGSKMTSNPPPPPPPPPPPLRRQHDPSRSVSLPLPPIVTPPLNPFTNLSLASPDGNQPPYPSAPPQHPMLRVSTGHNPFAKIGSSSDPSPTKLPPLPPRKAPPVPPSTSNSMRHAAPPISIKRSTSPTRPSGAAPTPPPKPVSHVTSTLIKQSLHASKVAQSLKKAEEQLEKERIMQVLKSSSGTGSGVRNRSESPNPGKGPVLATPSASSRSGSDEWDRTAPPLPKRRGASPPRSATSYDQVALAGVGERGRSHSHPPSLDSHPIPPPMHPDRREDKRSVHSGKSGTMASRPVVDTASFDSVYIPLVSPVNTGDGRPLTPESPTPTTMKGPVGGKVFRSKSMYQTWTPPRVARKRPESEQMMGTSFEELVNRFEGGRTMRRTSLSQSALSCTEEEPVSLASLQRTFANLGRRGTAEERERLV